MYKVFFNYRTKAHSIVNDNRLSEIDYADVLVHTGSISQCKDYLGLLEVMYVTLP